MPLDRRQHALEHIKQARATAAGEWSWDERLDAARALGWGDVMAGPQEEMELTQGEGAHGA